MGNEVRWVERMDGMKHNERRAEDCYTFVRGSGKSAEEFTFRISLAHDVSLDEHASDGVNYHKTLRTQCSKEAAFRCGRYFHHGRGVDSDLEEAASLYEWFSEEICPATHSFRCLRRLGSVSLSHYECSTENRVGLCDFEDLVHHHGRTVPRSIVSYLRSPVQIQDTVEIGYGAVSRIGMACDPETQDKFAVKFVALEHFQESALLHEVEARWRLNHPCIARFLGWALLGLSQGGQIHTEFAENRSLN
jgi:hypothetical protein